MGHHRPPRWQYGKGTQNIFIDVHWDEEEGQCWKITVWMFEGEFDPETADYFIRPETFDTVSKAHKRGSYLRKVYTNRDWYPATNVRISVQPKKDAMVCAVVRKTFVEEEEEREVYYD